MKNFATACLLCLSTLAPAAGAEAQNPAAPAPLPSLITADPPRGFVAGPLAVRLTTSQPGLVIRYTTDGSEPTAAGGWEYTRPIQLTNLTVLRAAAFIGNRRASAVATHTYLMLDDVLRQPRNPPGVPSGPRAWNGLPSAYEMDPRVVNAPVYRARMQEALRALPALSVTGNPKDLFDPRTGLYLNSQARGDEWERPCSAELLLPNGGDGFQIDAGLRIQGNYNRIPEKSPKHSFRLVFKEKYGPTKLRHSLFPGSPVTNFNTLVLRADYNNSWAHWDEEQQLRGQRTRDAWMKDSARAMGWLAGRNRYVHLYLNGLYWGIYDLAERPDAAFAASHLGGHREDYDVINEFQAKDGTLDAFNKLRSLINRRSGSLYPQLPPLLDVTNFMDYLLLNYYAGNEDWGERKNWYALRRRDPPGPFQYFVWDGERILEDLDTDTLQRPYEPQFRLAQVLRTDPAFRLAFADRVQKHCFNDGALTPERCAERWRQRAGELDLAIIAESARWGYYRRSTPYTRDRDWLAEQRRLLHEYFPRRTEVLLDQLRRAGLYPRVAAPVFSPSSGGPLTPGVRITLTLTAPGGGDVYFTIDGTDPRADETGTPSPTARRPTSSLVLEKPTVVRARVLKAGTWSALAEASFTNR